MGNFVDAALVGLGLGLCLQQLSALVAGLIRGRLRAPWGRPTIREPGLFGLSAALHLAVAVALGLWLQHKLLLPVPRLPGWLFDPIYLGTFEIAPDPALALRVAGLFLGVWFLFFVLAALRG